jgi:hypothetical protein
MDMKDPGRTGIVLSTEACQIADMIQVAVMLSRSGLSNHWEDVDRLVRNSLAVMQIAQEDIDRFKSRPVSRAGDPNNTEVFKYLTIKGQAIPLNKPLPPAYFQSDDSTDRCRGAWFVTVESRSGSIGCCNGNMCRGLYLAWDSIVEAQGRQLKVNLLMNRASPWADIDSYVPREGKVVIRIKAGFDDLLVRIPEWTNWNEVFTTINNAQGRHRWSDHPRGYISVGRVQAGDKITVGFPMKQWVITTELPVPERISPTKKKECKVTLKGNTVLEISENISYPIALQQKYRNEQPATRKVARFVSRERFLWS